ELSVESLAYGGNGVARLNGFVVFVRRGLPGDVVRARVTKVKRNHAEAVATEVLQPGPNRVEAPCRHYHEGCGGWRFQDLAGEAGRARGREERLVAYDQEGHTGFLRHLVVREGRNTGQALVLLVTAPGELPDADHFVERMRRFPEIRSIQWGVNEGPAEITNI